MSERRIRCCLYYQVGYRIVVGGIRLTAKPQRLQRYAPASGERVQHSRTTAVVTIPNMFPGTRNHVRVDGVLPSGHLDNFPFCHLGILYTLWSRCQSGIYGGPRCCKRASRPPRMKRGYVPMWYVFFSSRLFAHFFDREVFFDELPSSHIDTLRMSLVPTM